MRLLELEHIRVSVPRVGSHSDRCKHQRWASPLGVLGVKGASSAATSRDRAGRAACPFLGESWHEVGG